MKRRSVHRLTSALLAVLVTAFVLLGQSAVWAQGLTPSANPPTGGAGVNNSYLTGSGFPAGVITGAVVHFGVSCATPQIASGPVTQVTSIGALRRFQFLIPASLAPGSYQIWLTGTAGAATFNTLRTPSCSTIGVTPIVRGTASLGAAIGGANVTLVDVNGNTVSGTTAADGTFALGTATLTPPFLVKVVTTSASGSFPAGTTLYSVSADGNASTNINVSVLTDLILRSYYSAQGINPDTAFSSPTGPNAAPSPLAVTAIANLVIPAVQLWLNNAGIMLTGGAPTPDALNLISSPFVAFAPSVTPPPSTLDAVLHEIVSESTNAGAVTGITIAGGTITETISPTYGADAMTFTAKTTDTTTSATSTAAFSGLALTPPLTPIIDGINASLAVFQSTVNAKGAALTGADIRSFYAPDYVNDGVGRVADSDSFASNVAGITINSLTLSAINSIDFVNNVADVVATFNVTQMGMTLSGTQEWIFKLEGGQWLLYGNQRIASVFIAAQSRTFQGGPPSGGLFVFADVEADTTFGVTNAIVSGTFHIWGPPAGATSAALFPQAQEIRQGHIFNQFARLSQPLTAAQFPPLGSTFTLSLTAPAFGNPSSTAAINNALTTESIHFNGISTVSGTGPLSTVVGKTVSYSWTLPTTYVINGVSLTGFIFDGPTNNPASHSCAISSNSSLTTASTSGSIAFPADMTPCGLNSNPIQAVQVFMEVDGTNGEQNVVSINYPF